MMILIKILDYNNDDNYVDADLQQHEMKIYQVGDYIMIMTMSRIVYYELISSVGAY